MTEFRASIDIFRSLGGLKLWQARHSMVLNFIDEKGIQTMIDFGTNEATLLQKVQRGIQVKHLIGVDVDPSVMQRAIENLQPQARQNDLQYSREYDQLVELYQGSALQKYASLKTFKLDLVTLVQVIEHIEQKYLSQLNDNIFGYLKPTYVFISTPNSDFNPVFKWDNGRKYRHDDHKFQWTREEFRQYVAKVCERYNYKATITGVGQSLMEEYLDKGYCSQVAIFQNMGSDWGEESTKQISQQPKHNEHFTSKIHPTIPLQLIYSHTNPSWLSRKENLISAVFKQLLHECEFHDNFLTWSKVLIQLKRKSVIRKLMIHDDKWSYDYFLKEFVCSRLKGREDVVCDGQGVRLVVVGTPGKESMGEEGEMEIAYIDVDVCEGGRMMEEKQVINEQEHEPGELIIYDYSHIQLNPRERRKPKQEQPQSQQNNSQHLHQSSSHSSSSQSSSSQSSCLSQNSWQSIELPQSGPIPKVTKKKRRPFKPRRPTIVKETNDNQ